MKMMKMTLKIESITIRFSEEISLLNNQVSLFIDYQNLLVCGKEIEMSTILDSNGWIKNNGRNENLKNQPGVVIVAGYNNHATICSTHDIPTGPIDYYKIIARW